MGGCVRQEIAADVAEATSRVTELRSSLFTHVQSRLLRERRIGRSNELLEAQQ
jgi:hypothetical protein